MQSHNRTNGNAASNGAIRILLIDDDPEHVNLLREYLNQAGGPPAHFQLTCVDRLTVGMHLLAAGQQDVVILGLVLPDSKGLETFFKLKAQSPGVPVVVLTDIRHEAIALEAMRRGAQDYLIKGSVDARLLKHVIRYALMEARLDNAVHHISPTKLETKLN